MAVKVSCSLPNVAAKKVRGFKFNILYPSRKYQFPAFLFCNPRVDLHAQVVILYFLFLKCT